MTLANTFSDPDSTDSLYLQKIHTHPDLTFLPFADLTVPFDQLYVNQTVTEDKREEKQEAGEPGKTATSLDLALHQMAMGSVVKQVEVDLWQKLRQDHRVVGTAPAWTGKSTLCKWVVQHCHTKMHWLPIYIPFRSLSQSSHTTLLSYLEQDYLAWLELEGVTVEIPQPDGSSTTVSLGRWLYDQWQAGQALLILDGADEEFERTKREFVLSAFPTTGTRMTRPRVFLTSRPGGEVGVLGFEKIELQELTREQIETLIRHCGVILDAPEKTQRLLRDMDDGTQARAWQLAGRPGHLIQMVVTYVQEGILLTWEEDQMDRIATRRFQMTSRVTPKLEPDDPLPKRQLTEELAFHSLFCRKGQSQSRTQVLDLLTLIIHARQEQQEVGYRPQQASRFLTDLCTNSGFLKPTRQGLVEWESIPWLQFFAASHLAQKLEPDTGDPSFHLWAYSPPNEQDPIMLSCPICHISLPQFAYYLWRQEWKGVFLMMTGVIQISSHLLIRLEQEPDDVIQGIANLFAKTLGRVPRKILPPVDALLENDIECKQGKVLNSFVSPTKTFILTILERALFHAEEEVRQAAAMVLGEMGGSVACLALERALIDENYGSRATVAYALGTLGNNWARQILERELSYADRKVRKAALVALGQIGNPASCKALERALTDEDEDCQIAAVSALGKIGNSTAHQILECALTHTSEKVRQAAADALGRVLVPCGLSALEEALNDKDFVNRECAVMNLGLLKHSATLPALERALNDSSKYVREMAVYGLFFLASKDPIARQAIERALVDSDWKVRSVAAKVLGMLKNPASRPALERALAEKNIVGVECLQALRELGDPIARPVLTAIFPCEDEETIAKRAEALKQGRSAVPLPALEYALTDINWWVRESAIRTLGQLGYPTTRPIQKCMLNDQVLACRRAAAFALGQLGDPSARPALERALLDVDPNMRSVAAEALGKLGCLAARPALTRTLLPSIRWRAAGAMVVAISLGMQRHYLTLESIFTLENQEAQTAAAIALGRLGDSAARPALERALRDASIEVRVAAAIALGHLGDPLARPALERALQYEKTNVGKAAVMALGQLGDSAALPVLESVLVNSVANYTWEVRTEAAKVLGEIGGIAAFSTLLHALQDSQSFVRDAAKEAIWRICEKNELRIFPGGRMEPLP